MIASLMIIWPVEYEIFEKEKGKYFQEKLNKTIFFVDEECLQRPVSSVHEEGKRQGESQTFQHHLLLNLSPFLVLHHQVSALTYWQTLQHANIHAIFQIWL